MPDWIVITLAVIGALDLVCAAFVVCLALCAAPSSGRNFNA